MDRPIVASGVSASSIHCKPVRPGIFVCTSFAAFVTIHACWAVALMFNLPSNLWCPPISFTGFLYPERAIYVFGFSITFLMAMTAVGQLHRLAPTEADDSCLHTFASRVLYVALIGMVGQAMVPFQSDTFTANFPEDLKPQTIFHLIFAAVFFYGSQIHAVLVLAARISRGNPLSLPWKLKTFLVLGNIFCLYLMSAVLPDSSFREGLSQRLGVVFTLGFFADYSRDMRKIRCSCFIEKRHNVLELIGLIRATKVTTPWSSRFPRASLSPTPPRYTFYGRFGYSAVACG